VGRGACHRRRRGEAGARGPPPPFQRERGGGGTGEGGDDCGPAPLLARPQLPRPEGELTVMKEDERGVWITCDPIEGTWVTPFATAGEAEATTRRKGRDRVFVTYGEDLHDVL